MTKMTTTIKASAHVPPPPTKAKIERKSEPRPAGLKWPQNDTGRRDLFLRILSETANVSRAARVAGISASQVYRWRDKMPIFSEDWDLALREALDTLEEVLRDRVINGIERSHFHGGEKTGTYKTYSDALLMFYLRAKRPDIYNKGGTELAIERTGDDESLNKQLDIIAARVKARKADRDAK